jgi:hypothetical protein
VTTGDLTRSIQVDARGEVAELKDNINTMIANLRETTERNKEQDWLKTNIARFTSMLQGQRDLFTVAKTLLADLVPLVQAQQGSIYQLTDGPPESASLEMLAGYAQRPGQPHRIELGEGLVGQCALEKQRIVINDVPPDYTRVSSSLGNAAPSSLLRSSRSLRRISFSWSSSRPALVWCSTQSKRRCGPRDCSNSRSN